MAQLGPQGSIGTLQLLEQQASGSRQAEPGSLDLDRGPGEHEGQGPEDEEGKPVILEDV